MDDRVQRVLLVEDNERNRKLARATLEMAGMQVTSVASGVEGVAAATNGEFDLVLLDIQLPDLDGAEVLAQLRAHPATSDLTIAAVTAFAMHGDRQRFLDLGFDGYLTKPIEVATFADHVRSLVRS